jgi:hypothetical protein
VNKCDDLIAKTEGIGYESATIQTDNGPRLVDFVRNNNLYIKTLPAVKQLSAVCSLNRIIPG